MNFLRTLILEPLEKGDDNFHYKPLQRKVLLFVSFVFLFLAIAVAVVAKGRPPAALLPTLIFGVFSLYGLFVGILGSEKAVANLWSSSRTRK